MKVKLITVGTLLCLVVLTCLLLVHALAIFPGVPAIRWFFVTSAVVLARLDAPAWVQAIGSILSIAGAFLVASIQLRNGRLHAIEAEQRRLLRRHNAVLAVAVFGETTVRRMCQGAALYCDADGELQWTSERSVLDMAAAELDVVRAAELESFYLVRGIRRMALCVEWAIRIDADLSDGAGMAPSELKQIKARCEETIAQARRALDEVQSAVQEFQEDPGIAVPIL